MVFFNQNQDLLQLMNMPKHIVCIFGILISCGHYEE